MVFVNETRNSEGRDGNIIVHRNNILLKLHNQMKCTPIEPVILKKDLLTYFSPVSHFYNPWKRQKTFGFLTFSGGTEMWHWTKMG